MMKYNESEGYKKIYKMCVSRLAAAGVSLGQCDVIADCLATADAFGVTSHGSAILQAHIERATKGGYNLSPIFKVIRKTCAFAVIDGDNAFGPVSAKYCLDYGIEKCRESGVYTVFSRNNNTFGPAFYYSLKAAEQGYIAFICSNSPAQMAPVGGKEKLLGTNPFSMVIPVPGGDPIIVDMATSVVAKSKFKEYKNAGKELPVGWALDVNGNPTTDPDEAMQGLIQPMAGFKGYAISMLIDIVSGVLSGASYLNKVGRFYSDDNNSMNVGFFITVMDPYQVMGSDYDAVINDYVGTIRKSKCVDRTQIRLPGDDRIEYSKGQANEQ